MVSVFPLFSITLAISLSYIAFIMLRNFPSIPSLIRLYHERMLSFVEDFSAHNEIDHVVFVFSSVNMMYYI
jgi:hypothetical protein